MIRSFIDDSVSYLSYGGHINFYDVAKKYLDRLLIEVLNQSLLSMIHGGNLSVSQAMQIAANTAVFEHACDLSLWQVAKRCGVPVRLVERPRAGLAARAVLRASQSAAYNALADRVNAKLDDFMPLVSNINLTADEAPQSGNGCMNEVVVYLDTLLSSAQQILPLEALYKLAVGALDHISDSIVAAFLSEDVKRFTLSAVTGMDGDVKKLEAFAEESFHSAGLSDLKKDRSFKDCLTESRQLTVDCLGAFRIGMRRRVLGGSRWTSARRKSMNSSACPSTVYLLGELKD
ncbi:uncharacterized protein A4U43_C10F18850 [Asparagus officinalis]|uniref:Exocyst complex subunit EXOC6/Sec15 C-terminal domain-containing protein n=2 Tax=Asparagus officinalis TaxID=4686 RepID=A0A5P1E4C8_ASPOF|nr:uncharacterized protein A4U43_C10F18850 [Asparagus officinalis]